MDDLTDEDLMAPYLPSADDIAAGCAAIQSQWSEGERERRARWAGSEIEFTEHRVQPRRAASTIGRD